jgi:hypothetical protein
MLLFKTQQDFFPPDRGVLPLRMLSVQFVRLKQYTVYSYPFHLLDLYVENILLFGEKQRSMEKVAIAAVPEKDK